MKLLTYFAFVSLLLVISSCNKDEATKTKTYLDYSGFVKEGLVAYYPMNGNVNDYGGNGHNGILHGAIPSVDRFGSANGAYSFDGEDDFIEILNSTEFNGKRGTICFWVRNPHSDPGEFRAIFSKAGTSEGGMFISHKKNGNDNEIETIITLPPMAMLARIYFTDADYFFTAVTFTENSLTTYYDGKFQEHYDYTPQLLFNNNEQTVYIGKSIIDGNGIYPYKMDVKNFMGELDDMLIYDRALTAAEINQLSKWKKN